MKVFGMCIDKRVVAGVAATAAVLWWLAPGAVSAALPVLALAICPLSMLLMMKGMERGGATPAVARDVAPHEAHATLDDDAPAHAVPAASLDRP